MTRQINDAGEDLIKDFEARKLVGYRDAIGIPTAGWGHTKGVKVGVAYTEAQAEAWIKEDLRSAEDAVSSLVTVPLTDNQFAALVSFVFNCGKGTLQKSTLLKKLNAGNYNAVPGELLKFVNAGGKPLAGLRRRRVAEAHLWGTGAASVNTSVEFVTEQKPKVGPLAKVGAALAGSSVTADQVFNLSDHMQGISGSTIGAIVVGSLGVIGVLLVIYHMFCGKPESTDE